MTRRVFASFLCATALGLAGCGDDNDPQAQNGSADGATSSTAGDTTSSTAGDAPPFEEDEADTVAEYKLVNYEFDGPTEVKGPKVYFKAANEGTEDHELEVLDSTGTARGEVEAMPPDAAGAAAMELEPGTYTIQCILETADGKVHKDLGMVAELTVS